VDYSPIGTSLSYGWWITWFQFVSVIYTFYALHIDTKKLNGAGNLLGVLAANTFQFTQQVLVGQGSTNASLWSFIHKLDGTSTVPSTTLTKYQRGSVVLFAGLIINNISNSASTHPLGMLLRFRIPHTDPSIFLRSRLLHVRRRARCCCPRCRGPGRCDGGCHREGG